jgi:hypothetical protein
MMILLEQTHKLFQEGPLLSYNFVVVLCHFSYRSLGMGSNSHSRLFCRRRQSKCQWEKASYTVSVFMDRRELGFFYDERILYKALD